MVISPRATYPMPMVSMTMENAGCPKMGRMIRRSSNTPNTAIAEMAQITDSQKGKLSMVMHANPPKAPSIMSSP